jgi:urease accessory protein
MNSSVMRIAAAAAVLIAMTGAAAAHPGHADAGGFTHGFLHPLGGLDHVLAMVAVGLYAALLGGRALWLVPATFVTVMALGGALGAAGYALPYTEIGLALSVVALGLAVALRVNLPTLAAMTLAGVFAVFHGHAHGAEMPLDLSGYEYAAGFLARGALKQAPIMPAKASRAKELGPRFRGDERVVTRPHPESDCAARRSPRSRSRRRRPSSSRSGSACARGRRPRACR